MAKFKEIREAAKYNPYAIGMAAAKKAAGLGSAPAEDLPKSVITKAHEIAKKIKANEEFDTDLDSIKEGILKPELEKGFPAAGVRTGAAAPKGKANTMPKDKKKAAGQPAGAMGEETESLDEISKKLALSYLDKAPKSARIHGMISTDYKNAAERKRNPGLKRALGNLSQKYKSKAWRREDGIKRAITKVAGDK